MTNEYKRDFWEFKNEGDLLEELNEEGVNFSEEEPDFYDIDKSREERLNISDAKEKLGKFGEDRPRKSVRGRKKFINAND